MNTEVRRRLLEISRELTDIVFELGADVEINSEVENYSTEDTTDTSVSPEELAHLRAMARGRSEATRKGNETRRLNQLKSQTGATSVVSKPKETQWKPKVQR